MDKYTLTKEESILMVIDIQEKLLLAMKHGKKVVKNTNILLQIAKALEIPVVVTEQYPKGLGNTVGDVMINTQEIKAYEKLTFSGCTSEVAQELEKKDKGKVIIVGMETHVCVFQTVRELLRLGYQVFVVSDAVCSRSKENFKNGMSLMKDMGAVITNTETVFFDLMKEAGTPEFKELSKLIK